MATAEFDLAGSWKKLTPQQRKIALQRMTLEQKQKLAGALGFKGDAPPTDTVAASPPLMSLEGLKSAGMTLRDKAIEQLPAIGGTVGGLVTGVVGAPTGPADIFAAGAGAAAGGGLGETIRQSLREHFHPEDKKMGAGEAAKEIGKQTGTQGAAELIGGGIGRLVGPTTKKAVNRLFYGADLGPQTELEKVLPEIQAQEKLTPSTDLPSFISTVKAAKDKIGTEVDTALRAKVSTPQGSVPLGAIPADVTPIATAIKNLQHAHPSNAVANPKLGEAIRNRAAKLYSQPRSYAWLNDRRIVLNDELNKFYALKTPADQAAYLAQHPEFEIDKAEADAIRDVVYPKMDQAAGKPNGYFETLQQKRGQLKSIETQATAHAKEVAAKSKKIKGAPITSVPRVYVHPGGRVGMVSSIGQMIHRPDPEAQAGTAIKKAFRRTGKTRVGDFLASPTGRQVSALPIREAGVAAEDEADEY